MISIESLVCGHIREKVALYPNGIRVATSQISQSSLY